MEQIIQQIDHGGFPDSLVISKEREAEDGNDGSLHTLLPFLLTGNQFQEGFQDYQDLIALENNLQEWQEKVKAYLTMLQNQQQAYDQQLPKVEAFLKGDKLEVLATEQTQLGKKYEIAASEEEPPFVLASGEEKRLIARLQRIDDLIEKSGAPEQFQVQKEIAQLMEGILTWKTVTEHPVRLWNLKKQMNDLTQNIESAKTQQTELAAARQQAETRFGNLSGRIDAVQADIPDLLKQVTALRKAEAERLQKMALAKLEQRKTLVNNYLIQARFGVASLLDISTERGVPKQ
ncbi:MAG: hypothetical protein ABW170_12660 [Candidatus Thiodiazotropha sp. L084R]